MASFTPRLTSDGIYYGQYAGYLYWDPAKSVPIHLEASEVQA